MALHLTACCLAVVRHSAQAGQARTASKEPQSEGSRFLESELENSILVLQASRSAHSWKKIYFLSLQSNRPGNFKQSGVFPSDRVGHAAGRRRSSPSSLRLWLWAFIDLTASAHPTMLNIIFHFTDHKFPWPCHNYSRSCRACHSTCCSSGR